MFYLLGGRFCPFLSTSDDSDCVCPVLESNDDAKGGSKKETEEHNEAVTDAVDTATAVSGGGPVFLGNVES